MPTKTFINLPVKDLPASAAFFTELGFACSPPSPDEQTRHLVISDDVSIMLHVEPFFSEFTGSDIVDTSTSHEVVVGLSTATRDEVDHQVDRAVAAGGQALGAAVDQGFMYMRAFRDLDGHQWSFIHLDEAALAAP